MNKIVLIATIIALVFTSCKDNKKVESIKNEETEQIADVTQIPESISINGIAQNPEGIAYNKNNQKFYLSSLNAGAIIQVQPDGSFKPFTNSEPFPMSTAGIQIDYKNNRMLAAAFNGTELMDKNSKTKGTSHLRIYNLETGKMQNDIDLASLVPDAPAYMANDVAVDNKGNVYVTDWYAAVVYKVDMEGNASVFWKNETGIKSGANGIDYHKDGYLLVSLVSVNEKKGLYENYGLIKVPLNDVKSANVVKFENDGFTGFDGMVLKENGNVVGVTNNGTAPGGNTLIELSSRNNWKTAKVVHSKSITPSTTVAVTPDNRQFVINQDFTQPMKEDWMIEEIKF